MLNIITTIQQFIGLYRKIIKCLRRKKDTFAGMIVRICGNFSFTNFKDGIFFFFKMKSLFNFFEDSNTIISDSELYEILMPFHTCFNERTIRMIFSIIEHFSKTVFTNGVNI